MLLTVPSVSICVILKAGIVSQKTAKSSTTKAWWTKTARLHRPQEIREIQRRMKEGRERIFNVFLERSDSDGAELVAVFGRLWKDTLSFGHYAGIRRGFTLAQELETLSKKKNEGYKAEIAKIILQHPDWTAEEIFEELDFRDIKFVRLGDAPRDAECWSRVAKESSYKMAVSRTRKVVARLTWVQNWDRIMKAHKKLRRKPQRSESLVRQKSTDSGDIEK
jgi:hypothetical protein